MNMCSVRQRPMPSAPNSRALAASSGRVRVRPDARAGGARRPNRAWSRSSRPSEAERAAPTRDDPPVPPSIVITSPSANCAQRSRRSPRAERVAAGHGRLAHAAGDDGRVRRHPAVRGEDALAQISPWMSSGVVSQRTRMTSSPARPRSSAVSASKTIAPVAAPGEAFRPLGDHLDLRRRVDHRMEELVELAGIDATTASSCEISPSRPCRRRSAAPPPRFACRCASAGGRASPPRP